MSEGEGGRMEFKGEGSTGKKPSDDGGGRTSAIMQQAGRFEGDDEGEYSTDTQEMPNTVVLVKMPYPVTLEVLRQIFSKVGQVLRIVTFLKNGVFYGLIEYPEVLMAQGAKLTLDGRSVHEGLCTFRIEYSKLAFLNVRDNNDGCRDYTASTGEQKPVSQAGSRFDAENLQHRVKSLDLREKSGSRIPSGSSDSGMSAVGQVKPYVPLQTSPQCDYDLSHLGAASSGNHQTLGFTTSTINGKSRRVYHPETQNPSSSSHNIPIFDITQQQDDDYVMVKRSDLLRLVHAAEVNKRETLASPPSRYTAAQSQPTRSTPPPRKIEIVTKPNDLNPLGKFEKLDSTKNPYKLIEKYVQNSHDIPDNLGSVRIHDIYAFKREKPKSKSLFGKKDPPHKMLLFYKTTPTGIKRLSSQKDTCIAFYDRVARAFAIPPKDLDRPLRQIILVCSVSLGKKNKSEHGFSYWCKKGYPSGYDSVKGVGRLTPVWGDSGEIDGVSVPVGETRVDGRYNTYELEYSEYVVWEGRRVNVWFAVDVEVMVGLGKREG